MAPEPTMHGGGEVVEGEDGPMVSIPERALAASGVEVGEKVLVTTNEEGVVMLIPWTEADLEGMIGE